MSSVEARDFLGFDRRRASKESPMSWRAGLLLFLVLLFPLGCATSVTHTASGGVIRTFGEREFEPTPVHETVYRMMEECTGIEGDPGAVHWKVALWVDSPSNETALKAGWHRDGDYREIVFYEEYVFNAETISHEVLHDLYDGSVPLDIANRCMLDGENLGQDEVPTRRTPGGEG
jgi:hypothetical protein